MATTSKKLQRSGSRISESASRTASLIVAPPPPPPPPELAKKFIVAKNGSRRVGNGSDLERSRKEAYEALRASQEEFFRKGCPSIAAEVANPAIGEVEGSLDRTKKGGMDGMREILNTDIENPLYGTEDKNTRNFLMEEAMNIILEPESIRGKKLVKALQSCLSISSDDEAEKCVYRNLNPFNCPLLGLQQSSKTVAAETSSAEFLPPGELPRGSNLCSLIDNSNQRLSLGRRTCNEGRQTRIQAGRINEEKINKNVKEMLMKEEKQRIPIAHGVRLTTDEPELTEWMNFGEQLRLKREMQQKLEEEEAIRRLRRQLVPKAQPMPFFDRPFVPKRSMKPQTIPKEPRFHIRPRQ